MRRPTIAVLSVALCSVGVVVALGAPAATALSSTVVISQVYGGGGNTGATYRNDFVELYNRGTTVVDLSGWSVQYASSAGTTWQVTPLFGFVQPGDHFLVQQAAGAGGTTNLPTPDAIGTIAMSGTSGKVALVASTTPCAGTTCAGVDFVGYGAANASETAPTPALSNTTAALRKGTPRGAVETDHNADDFTIGPPSPESTGRGFVSCSSGVVAIAAVQGTGAVSPCNGQVVTVEGVVTGWDDERGQDSSCNLYTEDAGVWLQASDAEADADPATSDGVFVGRVFPRTSYPLGTRLRVTGTVQEKFGLTQVTANAGGVVVVSSGNPLPAPVMIDVAAARGQYLATKPYYESLEGRRVTVATGVATAGGTNRFGELFVEPGGSPTDTLLRTSPPARLAAVLGTVDDAGSGDPAIPRTNPPSSTSVLADKGDTVVDLTGPLTYSFSNYKVVPQVGALPTVVESGVAYPYDRLAPAGATEVRIASFNLENYFPSGATLDCATVSAADNLDKTARLSDAIGRLLRAPDVVAVQEVADLATLQQLAARLAADGYGTYDAYLVEGNDSRGIDVGFLAKSSVSVVSATQYGETTAEPGPGTNCTGDVPGLLFDRPPLVLEFTSPHLTGTYAVVSNHFASKANPDEQCRAKQAAFNRDLATTLRANGRKVIVTGDLNAFEDEPALATLTAPGTGLSSLWSSAPADQRYSFQFNGLLQTLDHAVVDGDVQAAVVGFQYAHLDADYHGRATPGDGHHVSDHSPPVLTLSSTPTPVVPEAPFPVLLSALALVGLAFVSVRTFRSESAQAPRAQA